MRHEPGAGLPTHCPTARRGYPLSPAESPPRIQTTALATIMKYFALFLTQTERAADRFSSILKKLIISTLASQDGIFIHPSSAAGWTQSPSGRRPESRLQGGAAHACLYFSTFLAEAARPSRKIWLRLCMWRSMSFSASTFVSRSAVLS